MSEPTLRFSLSDSRSTERLEYGLRKSGPASDFAWYLSIDGADVTLHVAPEIEAVALYNLADSLLVILPKALS